MLKTTKSGTKYRPIGDRFKCCGVILKVKEHISDEVVCAGCYFENHASCIEYDETGSCLIEFRPDGKDVIFVKEGGEKC